jgi:hypothetical protein
MTCGLPKELKKIIEQHLSLAETVFGDAPMDVKKQAMEEIHGLTPLMREHFLSGNAAQREAVQRYVMEEEMPLLNLSAFSTTKGLAFTALSTPYCAPGGYASIWRLRELQKLIGFPIGWHVFSSDMSGEFLLDNTFELYCGKQQYVTKTEVMPDPYSDIMAHMKWSYHVYDKALEQKNIKVIYSRSQPIASHLPAIRYKKEHPEVTWYAEFGDPGSITAQNEKRYYPQTEIGACEYSDNYFENVEQTVYELADVLVFTNENQFKVMHDYCTNEDCAVAMEKKSLILAQTIPNRHFRNIVQSDYKLSDETINIGYFGVLFTEQRKLDCFFELATRPDVRLHIFAPQLPKIFHYTGGSKKIMIEQLVQRHTKESGGFVANNQVDNLEFLSIANRMDYLYVEDTDFPGPLNPYLPSKLLNYFVTDTRIIAKVQQGSTMAKYDHPALIKITDVDDTFLSSLCKRK